MAHANECKLQFSLYELPSLINPLLTLTAHIVFVLLGC